MAKLRTFICFELPSQVNDAIAELEEKLRPLSRGVRWSRPESIHLTLKFLGDVDEADIDPIAQAIQKACKHVSAFDIQLLGAGAFPNAKRPRIFWLGITEPSGALERLQRDIETGLESIGFEKEARAFSPHLTLGRVRFPDQLDRVSQYLEDHALDSVSFRADSVILMQSKLTPRGAVYTPLRKINLK